MRWWMEIFTRTINGNVSLPEPSARVAFEQRPQITLSQPTPVLKSARGSNHVSDELVSASSFPKVQGRFLEVNGERFWVKGVTYGTFRPNEDGEPFPSRAQVRDDFLRMREVGVNTVRLYTTPPDW